MSTRDIQLRFSMHTKTSISTVERVLDKNSQIKKKKKMYLLFVKSKKMIKENRFEKALLAAFTTNLQRLQLF